MRDADRSRCVETSLARVRRTGKVSRSDLAGARVLVVDDHWHVANAVKSLLEVEGAAVIGPAATTADAHRLASEQELDLAIVDINLRGEMSYALIDQLYDSGIPVVVVSGYAVLPQLSRGVGSNNLLSRGATVCARAVLERNWWEERRSLAVRNGIDARPKSTNAGCRRHRGRAKL